MTGAIVASKIFPFSSPYKMISKIIKLFEIFWLNKIELTAN